MCATVVQNAPGEAWVPHARARARSRQEPPGAGILCGIGAHVRTSEDSTREWHMWVSPLPRRIITCLSDLHHAHAIRQGVVGC